jgi:hypothetical protein
MSTSKTSANTPDETEGPFEFYFDAGSRSAGYWLRMKDGRFLNISQGDLKMHAMKHGVNVGAERYELSPFDELILDAQNHRSVDYAGPLSGYRTGLHQVGGRRVLVTNESRAFESFRDRSGPWKESEWPFIASFLDDLIPGDAYDFTLSWLSLALKSLLACDFRPGQVLTLCGPARCGKSFLQVLITELLGGRASNPYQYMVGKSNFNQDIAEAEHGAMEDAASHRDIASRRAFGTSLKELTVNATFRIHAKGRAAVALPCYRRLSLSVNDEPENLLVLPVLDGSILEKLALIRCHRVSEKVLGGDYRLNMERLRSELPAFGRWLLRRRIVPKLQEARFGVCAYHDQELLNALTEQEPHTRLLSLLDMVLWAPRMLDSLKSLSNGETGWRGQAIELERLLAGSDLSYQADRMLPNSSSLGTYLGRLALSVPGRVSKRASKGVNLWEITRPKSEPEDLTLS